MGDTTVLFGHGGRHLTGTGLSVSEVNNAIALDVINNSPEIGQYINNYNCY